MSQKIYLPGIKPVIDLLEQTPEAITKVFCRKGRLHAEKLSELCNKHHILLEIVADSRLAQLAGHDNHTSNQGVLAELARINEQTLDEILGNAPDSPLPLLIALDQVQDPGNVGTLCRTAWAMGAAGLLVPAHNSAAFGPGVARSSAGAFVKLPIAEVTNLGRALDAAEERGFNIIGAMCGATDPRTINAFTFAWTLPAILVLGNEDRGLRPGILKRCHYLAEIPFSRKFDSLNVAQAGAILLSLCAKAQLLA